MTLTITIDDAAQATRVINDYCVATNYDAASGKTKLQWAKEKIILYLKQTAARGEFVTDRDAIAAAIQAINIY